MTSSLMLIVKKLPQLMYQIQNGENDALIKIVEFLNLSRAVDEKGRSLLHYSANCNNKTVTRYLLDQGCPIEHEDIEMKNALVYAMIGASLEVIQILFEAGADVMSVLNFFATEHRLSDNVRILILREFKKKFSTMKEFAMKLIDSGCHAYQFIFSNDPILVEYVLEKKFSCNSVNPEGNFSVLHIAVQQTFVEIVRILLKKGANVNALDTSGATPLFYMYQSKRGHHFEKLQILEMLLNAGASLISCNIEGLFQVSQILIHGSRELVRLVLQSDIDFTAQDSFYQRNILHELATNRNQGIAGELKHYISKFQVDVRDESQMSPLMMAVIYANPDTVQLLLEHGADSNLVERLYSRTPLYFAYAESIIKNSENQYHQCIELLLQHGADPQFVVIKNNEPITIFDAALKANNLHRLEPVIAHLARLEALGVPITEVTYAKINLYADLKKYFDRCRQILVRKIFGKVTVLNLLKKDRRILAPYFKNSNVLIKLERLSYNSEARFHTHYYITLKKYLSKILYDARFKKTASEVVCKILPNGFPQLVIDKITSYLNHTDLCLFFMFEKSTK